MRLPILPRIGRPTRLRLLAVIVLASTSQRDVAAVNVEAYAGEPFGVACATFYVDAGNPGSGVDADSPYDVERLTVREENSRAFYPVVDDRRTNQWIRLVRLGRRAKVTMLFLFRGDAPLELKFYAPKETTVVVTPQSDRYAREDLLDRWWRGWNRRWNRFLSEPEFPPIVENFLTASLARRMKRANPQPLHQLMRPTDDRLRLLGELAASVSNRLAIDREIIGKEWIPSGGLQSLPAPLVWPALQPPEASINNEDESQPPGALHEANEQQEPKVEPIARHVPAECFYVRFGSYSHLLWLQDLNDKWRGNLSNMVVPSALRGAAMERLLYQLSVRQGVLAKVMGPQVIADVALVGLDPFLSDGAAIGLLFEARNNFLLRQSLLSQRREALGEQAGAEEKTVRIAGRDVSLVASPYGHVRSYYVTDGDYHLVSTSRRLVKRFIEAGRGESNLAGSPGFLHVRRKIPADRDAKLFAYASPEFFANMLSPACWIERRRRVESAREMLMLQLVRYQAALEGVDGSSIADWTQAGLLPMGFAKRHDGSELVRDDDGQYRDSLRGAHGVMLPVADIDVTKCTVPEAVLYQLFAESFRRQIGQPPPLAASIRHLKGADADQIELEVAAVPLKGLRVRRHARLLGPATTRRMAAAEDDLAHFDVVLEGWMPMAGGAQPAHHLFGAAKDSYVPPDLADKLFHLGTVFRYVRGYLGTYPYPGVLKPLMHDLPPEQRTINTQRELWIRRTGNASLVATRSSIVDELASQLSEETSGRPAQAWFEARPLAGTQWEPLLNAIGYRRECEASVAAGRLMNSLANQLQVPPDDCRALAETLLDGEVICPLGGKYQLAEPINGLPIWTSTALSPEKRMRPVEAPAEYQIPLLGWLRDVTGDMQLIDDALSIRVRVNVAKSALP